MSFVQSLRMRNMFPINSDLGSAKIDLGGQDPMYEIINEARNLGIIGQQPRTGLQTVAQNMRPQKMQRPVFGGMVETDPNSNPGANILANSRARAEQTYNTNVQNQRQPSQVAGSDNTLSRDESHLERYFDRQNKQKVADATLANAGDKGWRVANITDPNDPSKTVSARVNDRTGQIEPLATDGIITRTGSVADIQKRQDIETAKAKGLESARSRATEGLSLIDQLINPDGTLKPDTEWVTGFSANLGTGLTPKGAATVGKIDRLKNSLTLDLIRELKEQSKTGATGFGALNLKELGVLENSASMLDRRNMEEGEYASELGRIRERLQMILKDAVPSMKPVASHSKTEAPTAPAGWQYVRNATDTGWTAKKIGGK